MLSKKSIQNYFASIEHKISPQIAYIAKYDTLIL